MQKAMRCVCYNISWRNYSASGKEPTGVLAIDEMAMII